MGTTTNYSDQTDSTRPLTDTARAWIDETRTLALAQCEARTLPSPTAIRPTNWTAERQSILRRRMLSATAQAIAAALNL